ncbi:MAG: hypothetical protein K0B81_00595 [Candidatus Cloacimonetes bacterium]|nr:hypothetical protein [Candidatus Cloacimonadota bacterium]
MRKLLLLIVLFLLAAGLWSYDSGKKPFQAMFLSLAIPGGGQFYNESYYKAAIVFALEGYFIGRVVYNNKKVDDYYDLMKITEGEEFLENERLYNRYYIRRQNDLWWLGTVIFFSMVDAFVDANLYNYEQEREKVHIIFENSKIGIGINF